VSTHELAAYLCFQYTTVETRGEPSSPMLSSMSGRPVVGWAEQYPVELRSTCFEQPYIYVAILACYCTAQKSRRIHRSWYRRASTAPALARIVLFYRLCGRYYWPCHAQVILWHIPSTICIGGVAEEELTDSDYPRTDG